MRCGARSTCSSARYSLSFVPQGGYCVGAQRRVGCCCCRRVLGHGKVCTVMAPSHHITSHQTGLYFHQSERDYFFKFFIVWVYFGFGWLRLLPCHTYSHRSLRTNCGHGQKKLGKICFFSPMMRGKENFPENNPLVIGTMDFNDKAWGRTR